jgi:hypothetical protein
MIGGVSYYYFEITLGFFNSLDIARIFLVLSLFH